MNNTVGVIAVTVSAITGAAVGYAIAHWRLSSIFAAKSDSEIAEMDQYYRDKYNDHEEVVEEPEEDETSEVLNAKDEVTVIPHLSRNPMEDVKYSKILGDNDYGSGVVLVDEKPKIKNTPDTDENPNHILLTSDEAGLEGYDHYDVIYLTYFYNEDLLLDFMFSRVTEPYEYIGNLALPKPKDSEDHRIVCVLNHEENILVEVTIDMRPLPDTVYERHQDYVRARWLEIQEEADARREKKGGDA